jgi:hypothetical protein
MQMAINTLDLNQPAVESEEGLAPAENSKIQKTKSSSIIGKAIYIGQIRPRSVKHYIRFA